MGWIENLVKTYDNCISEVGKITKHTKRFGNKEIEETIILLPESHLTISAEIEIRISITGDFISARRLDKSEQLTIVPVTEDSASRSSGIAPMPLCDKLSYIAYDYDDYVKDKKKKKECFEQYSSGLHKWADLPTTPRQVKAICTYIDKHCVMKDVVKNNIYDDKDVFVRFVVTDTSEEVAQNCVWLNKEIYDSFILFYKSFPRPQNIDYITGKTCETTQKLPAKIRNSGDKAKIISSNDITNFTFRGRFLDAADAATVGYETSQKAHNALRWLIAKQGYRNDSEVILCWSPGNEVVPSPLGNTIDLFDEYEYYEYEQSFADTEEIFAKKINNAICGYLGNFYDDASNRIKNENTKIIILGLDSADGSNQGRLALTYYNEQNPQSFIDNIFKWHKDCSWEHYSSNLSGYYLGAPSPKEIALTAFGIESSGRIDVNNKKLLKKTIDRLLPCIVQCKKIPKDIVRAIFENISNPLKFEGKHRNMLICNACSVIKKYQIDYGKEVFTVALNKESTDRDYLFGRLLAVVQNIEEFVDYKSGNSGRETNATKYWSVYIKRPAKTYSIIRQNLQPYISKLSGGSANYYLNIVEEIFDKFSETDSFTNDKLGENYLMGYYSQMREFRKNKKSEDNIKENA